MKQKRVLSGLITLILTCLLCACSSGDSSGAASGKSEPVSPISEAAWASTVNDMMAVEGDSYSTYDSVYGGTTYSYPKEYLGREGTIKYMFDEKEELMCIAWAYGSDDENELYTLYDEINQSVNDVHGESGYNADSHASNYGNVWYLKSGDIILSTMITSDNKALQYAYLNPVISNAEKHEVE